MYWLEVSVRTDGEAAEAVAEGLRPFAYGDGVVLEQQGDPHHPDPEALEPDVTVKIYVAEDDDSPALRRRIEEILYHLNRLYPIPAPEFRQLEEEDWANAWKQHYKSFRVGHKLWIRPSWLQSAPAAADALVITLDPGMAFGTGLHPTTQMCLQALEDMVRAGMRVLDLGTGSGILAIAAARLGATSVVAADIDPLAIKSVSANAEQNQVKKQIAVVQGSLASVPTGPYDIVIVNILAPVIAELLVHDRLLDFVAEDGRLILSGIIATQAMVVEIALAAVGGKILRTMTIRDWVSYVVRLPEMVPKNATTGGS